MPHDTESKQGPDDGSAADALPQAPARVVVAVAGESTNSTRGPARSPRGFTTYEQALAFVMDRVNVERTAPSAVDPHVFKLDRMAALMTALGDPQDQFKSVHVAGSKGKGSVCEMTAACLQGCGLTAGVYTSPHLIDIRERVRLGKEMIPKEDFRVAAERVAQVIPGLRKAHGEPTYFEVITAMAFLYFAEQAVDVAIIEVGLGGRLDSTNVIKPVVCAITAIQLEHTDLLGSTLEAIAREKAGIIKAGVPAVTIAQQRDTIEAAFHETAAAAGTTLRVVGRDIEFSSRMEFCPELGQHVRVCLNTPRSNFEHLPVPLKGEHQAMNLGLVLAVLDELRGTGLCLGEREIAIGLAETHAPGRMELIHNEPRIFVDGAHNPESIGCLTKAMGAHIKYDSLVVIFGCAKDKDVRGMLERLATGADKVIFTKASGNSRAAEPRDLQRKFAEIANRGSQVASTVKEALNLASLAVTREDVVCVTGSFYMAGEAKRLLAEKYGCCEKGGLPPVVKITEIKPKKPA